MHSDTTRNDAASTTQRPHGARDRDQQPRGRATYQRCRLSGGGEEALSRRQQVASNDGGHDRGARRLHERGQTVQLEDGHESDDKRQVTDHDHDQGHRSHHRGGAQVGRHHDDLTVPAVRKNSGQWRKQDIRQVPDRLDNGRLQRGLRFRPDHPHHGQVEEGVAEDRNRLTAQ